MYFELYNLYPAHWIISVYVRPGHYLLTYSYVTRKWPEIGVRR